MPGFCITVRNIGRLQAVVTRVSVATDGLSLVGGTVEPSPRLPSEVGVSSAAYWFYEFEAGSALVLAARTVRPRANSLRAVIELGTGKTKRSQKVSLGRSEIIVALSSARRHTNATAATDR